MDSCSVKIVRREDGGPGRAEDYKIENCHIGDCRHVDVFSRTQCHLEMDSGQLGN